MKPIIILIAILVGVGLIVSMFNALKRKAKSAVRNAANRAIDRAVDNVTRDVLGGVDIGDVARIVGSGKELSKVAKEIASEPAQKSVAGATNLYLPQITKDFADFHNAEAVSAIQLFMNEYLDIKYGEKRLFENSNIEPGLEMTINKLGLKNETINVDIHKVAITNYIKTNEYATITYQVAIGYNVKSQRKEEKYQIEYTMKLSENGIADKALRCDICGATIDSAGIEVCPYCDARILRDTRMSWRFTAVKQL